MRAYAPSLAHSLDPLPPHLSVAVARSPGFPRAVSIGFPMCHDQVFELEDKVGTVHNVLLLDDDVTARVAATDGASNAAATATFDKEQRPVVDHFATLGKVFTVDARASDGEFTAAVVEILT